MHCVYPARGIGIRMKSPTSVLAANLRGDARLTIAAAGDIHCSEENRDAVRAAFDAIEGEVDAVLLAGDLTTHGEPEQAAVLAEIALCPFRVALLHYAPIPETLRGEPVEIWPFLGSDRLAAPLLEHRPDLVLHGHAHAGRFETSVEDVPVYNVSVPVMRQDFWVFELHSAEKASTAIH